MKAISLWQPWATLWLLSDPDEKVFETRHWSTDHRGPLLVYATKKKDGEVRKMLQSSLVRERLALHGLKPEDLTYGALIGKVDLVDCKQIADLCDQWGPSLKEATFGNWTPERFAFKRGPNPELWTKPVPWFGHQGKLLNIPMVCSDGACSRGKVELGLCPNPRPAVTPEEILPPTWGRI